MYMITFFYVISMIMSTIHAWLSEVGDTTRHVDTCAGVMRTHSHYCFNFRMTLELKADHFQYDSQRITSLSNRLLEGLLAMEHTTLNGDRERHYPGCVNVSFAYVEGESLLMALKDIALSSGSACTSASLEPSYVLRALGSSDESAHSSIRFGIGRFTTTEEIDYVLNAVRERVTFLRELSPLWELVQEGVDLNTIEWSQH